MSIDMSEDESEILCRMLDHDRLDYPVSRVAEFFYGREMKARNRPVDDDSARILRTAEARAEGFVQSMTARGFVEASVCGPRSGDDPEVRPHAISLTALVAGLADVVAEIPADGHVMRWMPRDDALAVRRAREGKGPPRVRAYNETDLLARQARRGDRAEGLDAMADPRGEDLDDAPDDGRARRPTRLLGIGQVWHGPTTAEAEVCPVCRDAIPAPGRGEVGAYCLKCDAIGGERPPRWKRSRRRTG